VIAAAKTLRNDSMVVPVVVGAAAVGGALWWRHRTRARNTDDGFRGDDIPMVAPDSPPSMPPGRWIVPVPR
jgi:multidrug resistance efflux pump